MAEPKNKEQSLVSLKSKFEKKYGISYGSTIGIWDRYKAKNLVYITDKKGESYWFDNRTKQRVTSSYKSKTYRELKDSNQAVTNFGKISISRLGKSYNLLDLQAQLATAESRARFYPEAKPGDQPRKGDTPHYTYNKKGELVITGGKIQYEKNKTIRDLKAQIEQAELGISQVVPNKYNHALSIMGLGKKPTTVSKEPASDGSVMIPDANGKLHKTYPNDILGHYAKFAKDSNYVIPVSEGKVREENDNLPAPESERSNDTNQFRESSPFNKPNTSLNISPNPPAPKLDREGGVPSERSLPKTRRNEVITPKNQVGKLRINPGGLVGRYDDVRRSDGRSTSLSIAQEDFMGIKKGENLGVLTRSQRDLYDKEVLKIGG